MRPLGQAVWDEWGALTSYSSLAVSLAGLKSWNQALYILLGQWLNFKLLGITYLVGKIKFKLFFQGPLAE